MRKDFSALPIFSIFSLMLLIVSACGPQLTGIIGETGEGKVGKAMKADEKCSLVWEWYERFPDEYGSAPQRPQRRDNRLARLANLYADSHFVPYFGFSYEQKNAEALRRVDKDVLFFCYGLQKGVDPQIVAKLSPLKTFFDQGFYFKPALAEFVRQRFNENLWRQKALTAMPSVSETKEGFAELEQDYRTRADKELKDLWPSEQKDFLEAVNARRAAIALILVKKDLPPPDDLAVSFTSARKIHDMGPYLKALAESDDDTNKALARQYHDRLRIIVAALVNERVGELARIPASAEGFQLSRSWFEAFNQTFAMFSEVQEVPRARFAFLEKREAIFQANKDFIYEKFSSLGIGQPAIQKEQALLAETFPLGLDTQLPFYQEFQRNYRKKKESAVLDLLDKGRISLQEYYRSLSDFAKDIIHGTPE